jgi:hypothetical protein
MSLPRCDECEAIRQEMLSLIEYSRQSKPGPNATPEQLGAWFDQREADATYTQRVRPRLSSLRARLAEHQKLTGHVVPLPMPSGGLASQNRITALTDHQ